MSDKQETTADIIAEMRERCIDEQHSPTLWPYFARLEAAHRRELAEAEARGLDAGGIVEAARQKKATAEKSSASGNAAAMREALKYASRVLAEWQQDAPFSAWNEYGEAIDRCRAALAATEKEGGAK